MFIDSLTFLNASRLAGEFGNPDLFNEKGKGKGALGAPVVAVFDVKAAEMRFPDRVRCAQCGNGNRDVKSGTLVLRIW